ncbi:MAG TPA: serine/threonine-protein kinase [Ktedonosporobacter sp.]|jgi:serine/threonine protein kinase|nr:serine/threonine-protein kinase [Ktedonosporobacter sp.]
MAERIGQQFGNYRLVQLLGKGGFADTYLGEHIHLKTFAAIKVLQTLLGQPETEAFHNEAHIIARLNHPHIIHILEFEMENHTPYIIMEYAPNGTLRQRCPRGSRLSPTTVLTYVKQIAAALQYAHQQKLVHRDVKPENMLLGRDGKVLLSDFGVAVIAQTQAQNLENIAGTVTYMAPEQIQGKPCPASDQYALGITAYEWLCGSAPFGGTYSEIALQHECVSPPSLKEQISAIPAAVEDVIFTSLAKDPRQRFASVEDFAAALEEACQDLPRSKYPTTIVGTDPQLYVPTEIAPFPQLQAAPIAVEVIPPLDQQIPSQPSLNADAESLPIFCDHKISDEALLMSEQHPHFLRSLSHLSNQQSSADPLPVPGQVVLSTSLPSSPHNPYALILSPGSINRQVPVDQQFIPPGIHPSSATTRKASPPYRMHTSIEAKLLLILLTVLIIAGSGFLYFSISYQTNLLHVQATAIAGVSIISTIQVRATGPGQVAATAQPHINAAIATRTALQNTYAQATGGLPTINDPLSDPDDFGWSNAQRIGTSGRYTGSCQFTNNAYRDEALAGYLINCMAAETYFSNLAYQVDMTIISGNSGGLVIRANASGSGYYFCISVNGAYFLEKIASNGYGNVSQTLLASGSSPVIKKGYNTTNQLAVVAQGQNLYLYTNKQYIDSVSDAGYSSGQIGVYARGSYYKTAIIFRNARVWKS